ncbi:sulfite exporter TauE/SafE family protein [Clostridium fermenticellae]|uniref:Probable membrane transporter protein n=1 Tax=Clostridium fermenticellae TaxID=2068654 RepID=A0A386H0Q5_9CLOT|nr:sulfite exporter TauE/SafE family protein [Clostridium fermenticellae]AYD39153.1 sulfite exporter TauE/SafE family protein [Clostridium fermenticellae]
MLKVLLILLAIFAIYFLGIFIKDYRYKIKNNRVDDKKFFTFGLIGFIVNFFDTLGIGSFAIFTAILKNFKLTHDRTIPGTLNVACAIPVAVEALVFINVIKVDVFSLILMIIAATLGAVLGAGFVSKLDERKVQIGMGTALLVVAFIMFAGQVNLMPSGGNATSLSGVKLCIGLVGNFIFGAFMTLGVGIYAPCMALVFALGMSPRVAFPVMMGSCAFLEIAASIKFVKEGAYDVRVPLPVMIFGSIGVLIAAYIVKQLPLFILKWVVIVVIIYTSIIMFMSAFKNTKNEA